MKTLVFWAILLITCSTSFAQTPSWRNPFRVDDSMVLIEKDGTRLTYEIPGEMNEFPAVAGITKIIHSMSVMNGDTFYVAKWIILNSWVRPMTPAWDWWYQMSCSFFGNPVTSDMTMCWDTGNGVGAYLTPGGLGPNGNSKGMMYFMAYPTSP